MFREMMKVLVLRVEQYVVLMTNLDISRIEDLNPWLRPKVRDSKVSKGRLISFLMI